VTDHQSQNEYVIDSSTKVNVVVAASLFCAVAGSYFGIDAQLDQLKLEALQTRADYQFELQALKGEVREVKIEVRSYSEGRVSRSEFLQWSKTLGAANPGMNIPEFP
jgi:hypothetical protein